LVAKVNDAESVVNIDFSFLDAQDGGVIEILYQGETKEAPVLVGSIIGAPEGPQKVRAYMALDKPQPVEDDQEGIVSYLARRLGPIAVLCAFAAVSAVELGPTSVISIILYTVAAEAVIFAVLLTYITSYAWRQFGSGSFVKELPVEIIFGSEPPR
jgi:hypothetical protein